MASTLHGRAAGLATAMAGLLFVLFGLVYYCFTHGSTGEGRNGTLFGMGYGDYSRMQVVWPPLLALGLVAYHAAAMRNAGNLTWAGLRISLVALGLQVLGDILQFWVTDPNVSSEFYSTESTLGFYLGYLSFLLLAVGMVMTGISAVRTVERPRWYALPLLTGLLVMPTVVFPLLGFSNGTREWDLMYTASRVPLGLCLALIGTVLWSGAAAPGDRTPSRARRAGTTVRQAVGP